MIYLSDVNVCLALAVIGHVHHKIAVAWLDRCGPCEIALCRVVQAGLLRLLTNEHVMRTNVLTTADAWDKYDAMFADSRIKFVHEPEGLERSWRTVTRRFTKGHNFWTDAYLTAFADAAGFSIVTFDRDLTGHAGRRAHLLAVS